MKSMKNLFVAAGLVAAFVPSSVSAQDAVEPKAEPVVASVDGATEPASADADAGEATAATEDAAADTTVPLAEEEQAGWDIRMKRPEFSEDRGRNVQPSDWTFKTHGYVRMPLRFTGDAERPPYLVDDDYFVSGFGYTRLHEREWAEVFFSMAKDRTRLVVGLFASSFSDWSEPRAGEGSISTAFVEPHQPVGKHVELDARLGMFWDRYGYLPAYDTYLFGRTHIAGARVTTRMFDRYYVTTGFGAHSEIINSNQGFTPLRWAIAGVDLGFVDVAAHMSQTWTKDSERAFALIEDARLDVLGFEVRGAIPHVGNAYFGYANYDGDKTKNLASGLELLHSSGGRALMDNYFGPNSEDGTGTINAAAFGFSWIPAATVNGIAGEDAAAWVDGLQVDLFGMIAAVDSLQMSEDPLENRDDRTYLKWGIEPLYRPAQLDWLFASVRYDRVILDTDHSSMAFRVLTPRIGLTPMENLQVYAALSRYWYGENVKLRPNQIAGDNAVTDPDDYAFKLQTQISW